jgi:hypothetical protein
MPTWSHLLLSRGYMPIVVYSHLPGSQDRMTCGVIRNADIFVVPWKGLNVLFMRRCQIYTTNTDMCTVPSLTKRRMSHGDLFSNDLTYSANDRYECYDSKYSGCTYLSLETVFPSSKTYCNETCTASLVTCVLSTWVLKRMRLIWGLQGWNQSPRWRTSSSTVMTRHVMFRKKECFPSLRDVLGGRMFCERCWQV